MNAACTTDLSVPIVDDDPDITDLLRMMLQEQFPELHSTASLPDVLTEMESFHPDVVLVDFNLPGSNGAEGVAAIGDSDKEVTIIGMSGEFTNGSTMQREGANDFIAKPFRMGDLMRVMPA